MEKVYLLILSLLVAPNIPGVAYATEQPVTGQELGQGPVETVLSVWSPAHNSSSIRDLSLVPNSRFTVDVDVANAVSINSYQMALVYDPVILQATRIWFNDTIFSPNPATSFQLNSGNLYFAVFSRIGGFNGTGTLAHVELRVLALGRSGLDIGKESVNPTTLLQVVPGCFTNTMERIVQPDFARSPNPGPQETSEYMMGDVAVGIIMPQGPVLNWTDTDLTTTINGVKQAMDWWASQEPRARLRFSFEIHARVPVSVEPIQMSEFDDYTWIREAMAALNYSQGDAWSQVRAYNNDIREEFGTDWAFTIFVVASTGTSFANGGYAHAYLGGPWVTMARHSRDAFNSGAYSVAVPAHESGHIFYATDEYDAAKAWSGYYNAPDFDGSPGIMNRNSFSVSASTRRQIGWVDCDGNGVLDILDTKPSIRLDPFPPILNQSSYTLTGAAVDIPYPRTNQNSGRDVSVNKIVNVQYKVYPEEWKTATASDGSFDNGLEHFSIRLDQLTFGTHYLALNVTNTVGNSAIAEYKFTVAASAEVPLVIDSWTGTRTINLGHTSTLLLKMRGINARNSQAWVQAIYEVRNLRTSFATSRASQTFTIQGWSEVELSIDYTIPNAAGRYEVIATLYYTTSDPAASNPAWLVAGKVAFRILATGSS